MSFWKKLFGVKESPKDFRAAFAEERPARSVAAGEAVCSRDFGTPDPYTPEQSAAFRKAARDGNLEKVEALLNENSALVFSEDYYGFTSSISPPHT